MDTPAGKTGARKAVARRAPKGAAAKAAKGAAKGVAKTAKDASDKPAYSAPALEKGLDVLELLADLSEGVTPSQIAQRLGRSLQEVYRVVMALERRGYLRRSLGEETLILSTKLHDLACRYPPMRRLIDAAQPLMNRVSFEAYQALHVAVLDGTAIRVIAQVDSPAPLGFRLRVGTQNPAAHTASGRLLIAYQRPAVQDWLFEEIRKVEPASEVAALKKRIAALHARGYEVIAGEQLKGITDISFPILDADGYAPAVLTMPFFAAAAEKVPINAAAEMLFDTAATISALLGGAPARPTFPLEGTEGSASTAGKDARTKR